MPMKVREDKAGFPLIGKPGKYGSEASEHVGKFLWLVRETRPDLAIAVSRIG